jgi:hypothetical protein
LTKIDQVALIIRVNVLSKYEELILFSKFGQRPKKGGSMEKGIAKKVVFFSAGQVGSWAEEIIEKNEELLLTEELPRMQHELEPISFVLTKDCTLEAVELEAVEFEIEKIPLVYAIFTVISAIDFLKEESFFFMDKLPDKFGREFAILCSKNCQLQGHQIKDANPIDEGTIFPAGSIFWGVRKKK